MTEKTRAAKAGVRREEEDGSTGEEDSAGGVEKRITGWRKVEAVRDATLEATEEEERPREATLEAAEEGEGGGTRSSR